MFYERFEKLCKAADTSPCAVTISAGMSKSNVTQWKNGMSPTLSTISKLAMQLKVPVTAFLEEQQAGTENT